jgi:hypothetical protein
MSDAERNEAPETEGEAEDAPRNPFDNPLFLPVLLFGLALWFGYDGWINQDPKMLEHLAFNRYGFGVLAVGFVWSAFRARAELRAAAEAKKPE